MSPRPWSSSTGPLPADAGRRQPPAVRRRQRQPVPRGGARLAHEAPNGPRRVGPPWLVPGACIRIITHPRASDRPLAPEQAWSYVTDAQIAALAIEHGLTICSADPDVARFRERPWHRRSRLRCESVVMRNHPTHHHQLPGGGVPHEASFVGTPGGPGRTRSRGAGFLLCTPRSRLRGDPRSPREAGFAGTPRCRRVPSNAGSYRGPHEASLVGSPYLGSTGVYPLRPTDGEHE